MGITVAPVHQHWNFFLAIEDDVIRLSRFIEPVEANFNTFSLELSRILLTASSEVDVVAKLFCQQINSASKANTITDYRKEIVPFAPRLSAVTISIPKFGLSLTPWEAWTGNKSPAWWKAHNDVKHERDRYFVHATLKHALNAAAALFALLLFFYREDAERGKLRPSPRLFSPDPPFTVTTIIHETGQSLGYALPADQTN